MVNLEYGFRAIRCDRRPGKWLGQFYGGKIGTRWVRGRDGAAALFESEEAADRAANAALIRALNAPPVPVNAKPENRFRVVKPHASGKQVRLVAEALFRAG